MMFHCLLLVGWLIICFMIINILKCLILLQLSGREFLFLRAIGTNPLKSHYQFVSLTTNSLGTYKPVSFSAFTWKYIGSLGGPLVTKLHD